MPPAPSGAVISYGPRRIPGESAINQGPLILSHTAPSRSSLCQGAGKHALLAAEPRPSRSSGRVLEQRATVVASVAGLSTLFLQNRDQTRPGAGQQLHFPAASCR